MQRCCRFHAERNGAMVLLIFFTLNVKNTNDIRMSTPCEVCVCDIFIDMPNYWDICSTIRRYDPRLKKGGMCDVVRGWAHWYPQILRDMYKSTRNWNTVFALADNDMWAIAILIRIYNVSVHDICNIGRTTSMNIIVHMMPTMSFEEACVTLQ